MKLTLVIRAETPATLAYGLKRPLMQHLGVIFPLDENDDEILNPNNWKPEGGLGPHLEYHYRRPNGVVITPGDPPVTDPFCWLMLQISGPVWQDDHEPDPDDTEPDNWRKSKLARKFRSAGTQINPRGVRARQVIFPQSAPAAVRGKKIQLIRGHQLRALGFEFNHWLGGNDY